ncbi:MAG TPA: multifunctional CCA addition/repair protein, partial [Gammaproteobacteria bacterium]|nr:multifunctional CCA addition/repair protein [Gammaproteobacteria bacterium]
MKVYRVGGSVRDQLLGLPGQDRDWVVVGASSEMLSQRGFRQVGANFPVFLHPHTREEYALARTERKSAPGYLGFAVDSSAEVTLEQDLLRRDLTINAMACSADGRIIDPYGGQEDLRCKILRHVSAAFAEDPVRVLRVARFVARFAPLGFTVHPSTLRLMQGMVAAGEVDHLVAERVWQETCRALVEPAPVQFFCVLIECDALERIFPEIDALYGVPQTRRYHPEIDSGTHTMLVLEATRALSDEPEVLFAALVHDLGKALTPLAELPGHRGHEQRGLALIDALCERLRVPRRFRRLALLVCRN